MAQKDELEAEIALLAKEVKELTAQVFQIDKDVAEATKIRAEEKVTNTQTIKEAKGAQDAVARALKVLQEFYAKAGIAESFLQKSDKKPTRRRSSTRRTRVNRVEARA